MILPVRRIFAGSLLLMAFATSQMMAGDDDDQPVEKHIHRTQQAPLRADEVNDAAVQAAAPAQNGILYHGGPVMSSGIGIYYIWYGNWSGNTAIPILEDLAHSIGGSRYFNINTTYSDGSGHPVRNVVSFREAAFDNYSRGKSLSDADVKAITAAAINSNKLPLDANGVYFVLTSKDVNETSGFCTNYCGWHTFAKINGTNVKYAFVGNAARCLSSCAAQTTGPNGNAGADGMASILAHELEESATDPQLNAWFDSRGEENGDKCAWHFGAMFRAPNGASANMMLGARNFLIQENWVNANGGFCALSF